MNIIKHIKICIGILIFIFISIFFKKPVSMFDYKSYISYSISGSYFISLLYIKYLWRCSVWKCIGLEKTPRLHKNYDGNKDSKKQIKIEIKQDLFTVRVKAVTDENTSVTISSNLVLENDQYILYYT